MIYKENEGDDFMLKLFYKIKPTKSSGTIEIKTNDPIRPDDQAKLE